MISRVAVSPSPSLIERSITTTSAAIRVSSSTASLPPDASPTTSISGASASTAFSPVRTMA